MPGLLGSWNPSKTAEMVLWPVVPLGLVSVSKEAYVSSTYISFLMGLLTALLLLWWCERLCSTRVRQWKKKN